MYYLPSLLKRDFRKDFVLTEKNYDFFSFRNFQNDIYINKKKKFFETEVCFVSHYVGIIDKKILIMIFIMEIYLKSLKKKKIKFSVILINHTEEAVDEVYRKFVKSQINRIIINNKFYIINNLKILIYIFYKFICFKFFKYL